MRCLAFLICVCVTQMANGAERIDVWPDLAPGETTRNYGEVLPKISGENPPATRVGKITRPSFTVHRPAKPNGTGVVILPGGAFARVVTDKEGSEIAEWLNARGVTAFVLSYRTKIDQNDPGWKRPLQDVQRTISLIRSRADEFGIKKDRIGVMGFSAGGHAAARLLTVRGKRAYDRIDSIDDTSFRPDFGMLIYPWNLYDAKTDALIDDVQITKDCPPTFIVHTDDDRSTSLGPVLFYAALKRLAIPAELHVYGNGGHGYGMRPVEGSDIATWPSHAAHWLEMRGLLKP